MHIFPKEKKHRKREPRKKIVISDKKVKEIEARVFWDKTEFRLKEAIKKSNLFPSYRKFQDKKCLKGNTIYEAMKLGVVVLIYHPSIWDLKHQY